MTARLDTLQAGRAVAAMMVVLFHINVFILPHRLYDGASAHPALSMGYAGVEFFFALSGFIMTAVHRDDLGASSRFARYVKKRIVRIYPMYWAVLFPLAALSWFVASIGPQTKPGLADLALNAALAPMTDSPLLEVAWTLQYEMAFYVIFGLSIVSRRIGLFVMTAWFGACAAALFAGPGAFPASFFFSAYNLIFLGGILAALAYRRLPIRFAGTGLALGSAGFFSVGLLDVYGGWPHGDAWRTVAFGACASLVVACLAGLEFKGRLGCPSLLKRIGDSSYALYLVHMPVMTAVAPIIAATGLPGFLPPAAITACLLGGCVVAGLIAHIAVEKPLTRFASRLAFPSLPGRPAGIA